MEGKTPETAAAKAGMSVRSALKWQNGHCRRRQNRSNGDAALSAYGELYGKVQRKLFANVAAGRSAASLKSDYIRKHGIPARMFNAVRVSLEGKVASVRESQRCIAS